MPLMVLIGTMCWEKLGEEILIFSQIVMKNFETSRYEVKFISNLCGIAAI